LSLANTKSVVSSSPAAATALTIWRMPSSTEASEASWVRYLAVSTAVRLSPIIPRFRTHRGLSLTSASA
jgi:hypothetical protein